jgi:hypothetical protein
MQLFNRTIGRSLTAVLLLPLLFVLSTPGHASVHGLSGMRPNPHPVPDAGNNSPGYRTAGGVTALTFEGLQNLEPVNNYYNGGTGGNGSGPGPNFGITFTSTSLALIDADAGGTGNFGGEPSPSTALFFLDGTAVMNVPAGFTTGFSFFYTSPSFVGTVNVYDGPDATGNLLTSLSLPLTPNNGDPDPTGTFSPFVPIGVSFNGTAKSVDFGGTVDQIAFDDITLGSATPGGGPDFDICCVDDASGDQLQMIFANASPGSDDYGRWQYTHVSATGSTVYCGRCEYVQYCPGLSLVARDNDPTDNASGCTNASLQVTLDFVRNKCTATVQVRNPVLRFVLRDRDLTNNTCGTSPPPR